MQQPICIIPARIGSTRLSRKALADIAGKPLVVHTLQNASRAGCFSRVIVATDSTEIFKVCTDAGFEAFMTSSSHQSGTDRIAEVVREHIPNGTDIRIVNLQGDEPAIPAKLLQSFCQHLCKIPLDNTLLTIASNATIDEVHNPDRVKVVCSHSGKALYFSRSTIPFARNASFGTWLIHWGIYGFTRSSLEQFCSLNPSTYEQTESLEQLRALENDMQILCLRTDLRSVGIDTEQDLVLFRQRLSAASEANN